MIRTFSLLTGLLLGTPALANGQVNHLDVNGDIVVFATDSAKINPSPSCMDAANSDKWAVSLNSESGRAIYSLLMTAMVTKMGVNVESSGDCADKDGYERAQRVWLDAVAGGTTNSAPSNSKLAPHLDFVSNLSSDDAVAAMQRYDAIAGEYVTALELQGKHLVSFLRLTNLPRELVNVRLTVDGVLIWDSGTTLTDTDLRLIGDSYIDEQFFFETNLKLEVKATTSGNYVVLYNARPII